MKIAISAVGDSVNSDIDPRFGRAQYMHIVDTDTMQTEVVSNYNAMASGGAGIATAQLVANKGAEVVLTGNCGPNAFDALAAASIPVVTGVSGKVKDAVEAYKAGSYQEAQQANVREYSGKMQDGGFVGGRGMGRGGGSGRGIGRGGRGGMGRSY